MPWGPGQSIASGSIATNINRLFVFGATDAYKDLVSGTTYTGSLAGTAAFGSDAIGTYVETFTNSDFLVTGSLGQSVTDSDYSIFLTFSRSGTVNSFAQLLWHIDSGGGTFHGIQREGGGAATRSWYAGTSTNIANNLATITTNTEFTVVVTKTGTTGKYFFKGGSAPINFTSNTFAGSKTLTLIYIGGIAVHYAGRFRAYGRWTRALSDAEAQSMADNPQQIITAPITYTYARPSSDITTQWSTSSGTTHYTLIDETVADDNDYIVATAAGQTDEVKLASMTPPQVGTNLVINYKVTAVDGGATVTASLRQGSGGTLIKADTAKNANGTYALTVAPGDWALVTDWSDLRLRFVSA
jgi:hypothetical protein